MATIASPTEVISFTEDKSIPSGFGEGNCACFGVTVDIDTSDGAGVGVDVGVGVNVGVNVGVSVGGGVNVGVNVGVGGGVGVDVGGGDGVNVMTEGDYSEGVYALTHGNYSDGIWSHTYGSGSTGIKGVSDKYWGGIFKGAGDLGIKVYGNIEKTGSSPLSKTTPRIRPKRSCTSAWKAGRPARIPAARPN